MPRDSTCKLLPSVEFKEETSCRQHSAMLNIKYAVRGREKGR